MTNGLDLLALRELDLTDDMRATVRRINDQRRRKGLFPLTADEMLRVAEVAFAAAVVRERKGE